MKWFVLYVENEAVSVDAAVLAGREEKMTAMPSFMNHFHFQAHAYTFVRNEAPLHCAWVLEFCELNILLHSMNPSNLSHKNSSCCKNIFKALAHEIRNQLCQRHFKFSRNFTGSHRITFNLPNSQRWYGIARELYYL